MTVRDQNLEIAGAVFAAFKVHQTSGSDDLTDADINTAVNILGNYEVGPGANGDVLLGKLVDLSLTDADEGNRVATVQIVGIMTLPAATTVPSVGDRVVVNGSGSVKQAPALGGNDPAGGNVARGTVIDVNGTSEVTLILH
jgi:predicted RecA/RadA family phage recombinase